MPRPYNQKTVKDALLLLDIYASNGCSFEEAASGAEVRPSSTGYRVAEHLIDELANMLPDECLAVIAGEAAGLLREGWRIGDEIPMRGLSATLENVDAILREHYGAGNVEAMADEPAPVFATLSKLEVSHGPAETEEARALTRVGEILVSPLDAVEEPTDEEIAHAFDDDPDPVTTEIVDNSADYEYDTTEPTE